MTLTSKNIILASSAVLAFMFSVSFCSDEQKDALTNETESVLSDEEKNLNNAIVGKWRSVGYYNLPHNHHGEFTRFEEIVFMPLDTVFNFTYSERGAPSQKTEYHVIGTAKVTDMRPYGQRSYERYNRNTFTGSFYYALQPHCQQKYFNVNFFKNKNNRETRRNIMVLSPDTIVMDYYTTFSPGTIFVKVAE